MVVELSDFTTIHAGPVPAQSQTQAPAVVNVTSSTTRQRALDHLAAAGIRVDDVTSIASAGSGPTTPASPRPLPGATPPRAARPQPDAARREARFGAPLFGGDCSR